MQQLLLVVVGGCGFNTNSNEQFIKESAFMHWAESNDLVVLFPQAKEPLANCWDWIGNTGKSTFATRDSVQAGAILAMVQHLQSGIADATTLAPADTPISSDTGMSSVFGSVEATDTSSNDVATRDDSSTSSTDSRVPSGTDVGSEPSAETDDENLVLSDASIRTMSAPVVVITILSTLSF